MKWLVYLPTTRYSNIFFYIACILSAIPIWLSAYPPMVDISMHANQVATFLRLLSGSELLAPFLEINWFTPYWAGNGLVILLSFFVPIVIAIKIVLTFSIIATPLLASRLRALISDDNSFDWFFLPVIYSFSFQAGFLNFIIGVPLVLLFLREFILFYFFSNLNVKKVLWISFLTHILFLTHIFILIFACGIAFAIVLFENVKKINKKKFIKILPLVSVFPIVLFWILSFKAPLFDDKYCSSQMPIWVENFYRFNGLLGSATGALYSLKLGSLYALAILILTKAKIYRDWRSLPFIITLLVLLFIPKKISGACFVAERFNVFIFIFFIFSFDFSQIKSVLNYHKRNMFFSFFSFIILCTNAYIIALFDQDTQGLKKILAKIEPHQRVISIIDNFSGQSSESINPLIYGSLLYWYAAEKNGYANTFFIESHSIVRYKKAVLNPLPKVQFSSESFNWDLQHQQFDYLILGNDPEKYSTEFLKGLKKYTHLIYREGAWHLYSRHHENVN